LGFLGAGAAGWIAYDQTDPFIQLVALTLAFASVLASITLAVLALSSLEEEGSPTRESDECSAVRGRRWNGTGSPRTMSPGAYRSPPEEIDRRSAV